MEPDGPAKDLLGTAAQDDEPMDPRETARTIRELTRRVDDLAARLGRLESAGGGPPVP